MNYIIKNFENKGNEAAFVKKQVVVHFDWPALLADVLNDDPFPHIFVAADGERTIGMILLNSNISDEIDMLDVASQNSMWIYRLFVDERYRNKGVGRALVQATERYAQDNGFDELWLDTVQAGRYYEEKFSYEYVCSAPYKDQMTRVYKKVF